MSIKAQSHKHSTNRIKDVQFILLSGVVRSRFKTIQLLMNALFTSGESDLLSQAKSDCKVYPVPSGYVPLHFSPHYHSQLTIADVILVDHPELKTFNCQKKTGSKLLTAFLAGP